MGRPGFEPGTQAIRASMISVITIDRLFSTFTPHVRLNISIKQHYNQPTFQSTYTIINLHHNQA